MSIFFIYYSIEDFEAFFVCLDAYSMTVLCDIGCLGFDKLSLTRLT